MPPKKNINIKGSPTKLAMIPIGRIAPGLTIFDNPDEITSSIAPTRLDDMR